MGETKEGRRRGERKRRGNEEARGGITSNVKCIIHDGGAACEASSINEVATRCDERSDITCNSARSEEEH